MAWPRSPRKKDICSPSLVATCANRIRRVGEATPAEAPRYERTPRIASRLPRAGDVVAAVEGGLGEHDVEAVAVDRGAALGGQRLDEPVEAGLVGFLAALERTGIGPGEEAGAPRAGVEDGLQELEVDAEADPREVLARSRPRVPRARRRSRRRRWRRRPRGRVRAGPIGRARSSPLLVRWGAQVSRAVGVVAAHEARALAETRPTTGGPPEPGRSDGRSERSSIQKLDLVGLEPQEAQAASPRRRLEGDGRAPGDRRAARGVQAAGGDRPGGHRRDSHRPRGAQQRLLAGGRGLPLHQGHLPAEDRLQVAPRRVGSTATPTRQRARWTRRAAPAAGRAPPGPWTSAAWTRPAARASAAAPLDPWTATMRRDPRSVEERLQVPRIGSQPITIRAESSGSRQHRDLASRTTVGRGRPACWTRAGRAGAATSRSHPAHAHGRAEREVAADEERVPAGLPEEPPPTRPAPPRGEGRRPRRASGGRPRSRPRAGGGPRPAGRVAPARCLRARGRRESGPGHARILSCTTGSCTRAMPAAASRVCTIAGVARGAHDPQPLVGGAPPRSLAPPGGRRCATPRRRPARPPGRRARPRAPGGGGGRRGVPQVLRPRWWW